jgi:hypothetical protein
VADLLVRAGLLPHFTRDTDINVSAGYETSDLPRLITRLGKYAPIKFDPEDGEFYFSRGFCRAKTGDIHGSVKDMKSALASEWLSDKKRKELKEILATYEKTPANPFGDDPAREASEDSSQEDTIVLYVV